MRIYLSVYYLSSLGALIELPKHANYLRIWRLEVTNYHLTIVCFPHSPE